MRAVLPLMAFVLLAVPGFAQAPAQPVVPAPVMPAPADAAPAPVAPAPAAPRAQRPANRPVNRFAAANTTHDGKLTLAQAQAGNLRQIVRNFAAIDKDGKGYVTRRDLAAYRRAMRAQKAPAAPAQ